MAVLSKQIRLEQWTAPRNGSGDAKEQVTKYNLWAEVTRSGGSRANVNGQTALDASVQFKIRFRPDMDITGNWRLVYDGKRYTVSSIEKDKEDRFSWIINVTGS